MLGDGADRALLIRALVAGDGRVDLGVGELAATGAPLDQQLELVALVKATDLARRIARVVPDPMLVPIGVEDHRSLAELRFQPVGIEFRLLLAFARILAGALGFDEGNRSAVRAP